MLASVPSATLLGVDGHPVTVEVHVASGLPVVHHRRPARRGLPRGARPGPGRPRCRAGSRWPSQRITVNLAPSALRKVGAGLDLAIAVGVLVAAGQLPAPRPSGGRAFLGELGLDGTVRPVRRHRAARRRRAPPVDGRRRGRRPSVAEAALVGRHGVRSGARQPGRAGRRALRGERALARARPRRRGRRRAPPARPRRRAGPAARPASRSRSRPPAATTCSCSARPGRARRCSPPGCPGCCPPLDDDEALEATRIHSAAGVALPPAGWSAGPPFRAPHHSASAVALVGGGTRVDAARRDLASPRTGCCSSTSWASSPPTCSTRCASRSRRAWSGSRRARRRRQLPGPVPAGRRHQPVPVRRRRPPGGVPLHRGARARYAAAAVRPAARPLRPARRGAAGPTPGDLLGGDRRASRRPRWRRRVRGGAGAGGRAGRAVQRRARRSPARRGRPARPRCHRRAARRARCATAGCPPGACTGSGGWPAPSPTSTAPPHRARRGPSRRAGPRACGSTRRWGGDRWRRPPTTADERGRPGRAGRPARHGARAACAAPGGRAATGRGVGVVAACAADASPASTCARASRGHARRHGRRPPASIRRRRPPSTRPALGAAGRRVPRCPGRDAEDVVPAEPVYPACSSTIPSRRRAVRPGRLDAPRAAPACAVVGTRRCTRYGGGVARRARPRPGRGRRARRVRAWRSASTAPPTAARSTPAPAPPVGVVGSGLDVVYPRRHRRRCGRRWRPPACSSSRGTRSAPRPSAWRFPARNRIIAALAEVVVVVESHAAGGSLHTVDEADRARRRPVLAVPGSVRSPASAGTNQLLADGCRPGPRRRRRARGPRPRRRRRRRAGPPSAARRPPTPDGAVLDALGWEPATARRSSRRAPASPSRRWPSRSTGSRPTGGSLATAAGTSGRAERGDAAPQSTCGRYGRDPMAWRVDDFVGSLTSVVAQHRRRPTGATSPPSSTGPSGSGSTGPTRVDRRLLRRYLAYLATRRLRPAHRSPARRRRCAATSAGCARTGALAADPSAGLSAPAGEGRLPRVLRGDELDVAARRRRRPRVDDDPPPSALRDDAVLELLYGSGLRVGRAVRPAHRTTSTSAAARVTVWGKGSQAAPGARSAEPAVEALRALAARAAAPSWPPPTSPADAGVPQPAGPAARRPATCRRILDRRARRPDPPPRPAPHLRHPPARRRCRPAGRAGAARPRRPGDHAALHSRQQGAAAAVLRRHPPPGLGRAT